MKLRIALLLFLIFSASAITITAATFAMPTPNIFGSTLTPCALNFKVQPLGDPVDNPVAPM